MVWEKDRIIDQKNKPDRADTDIQIHILVHMHNIYINIYMYAYMCTHTHTYGGFIRWATSYDLKNPTIDLSQRK